MSIKPKTLPILLTLGVCVCVCVCVWGDREPCRQKQSQTHIRQIWRDGVCHKQRERDKQRKAGRAKDTQQADGEACEPPGSAVMTAVGNTTERVHVMF